MLLSVRIVAEVVDQIPPTHIQHGAGRDDRTEAYLLQLAPIENRSQQGSALAQKRYVAGTRRVLGEGSVQPDCRIHYAQAIGANQAHGASLQLLLNLPFELDAFRPSFPKSG